MKDDPRNVDCYDYHEASNPAKEGSQDAVDYSRPESNAQPGNPEASHELPSKHMDMTPEKAKTILHDKSIRGHPLSAKQRGLFGAIASKGR
jgi:hypothetical protein